MIEIQNVSKSYNGTKVLDSITTKIKPGGITAIVGGNGAGKSTLLSLISQLETVDSGKILFNQQNMKTIPRESLARQLSILRQDNHLMGRLTVKQLVSFGRYPYSKGIINADDKKHIETSLEFLDLLELQNRYLDSLSGGQKQRAFIAMILCQDTDYILLDEPLNNLDIKHSIAIMQMIRRLADEQHKTILIVIHHINFAAAFADQILALKNGQLVCHGEPAEIMTSTRLHHIFDTSFEVVQHHQKLLALWDSTSAKTHT